jgi:hypothetical protein
MFRSRTEVTDNRLKYAWIVILVALLGAALYGSSASASAYVMFMGETELRMTNTNDHVEAVVSKLPPGQCLRGVIDYDEEKRTWSTVLERWERARLGKGRAAPTLPTGTCDNKAECQAETNRMCKEAGHGGVDKDSVEITKHANDNGSTCSGDCQKNGAIAFITCAGPKTIVDEPDPAGRMGLRVR